MFIFSNAMKRITCSFVCLASTLLVMAQEYYERNFEFLGNYSSASIINVKKTADLSRLMLRV